MVDFTVAIPTYNGEHRLPLVLEQLRSQRHTQHFTWAIWVIDNNSGDRTAQVVCRYRDIMPVPLHYCLEPRQGAGFARRRAMQEAESPLVGFLDDDNIPEANWVAAAYEFAQLQPNAGAYGSHIEGAFESVIPPGFEKLLPFLAITQRGSTPRLYHSQQAILPPAAGLVLRKHAWEDAVPQSLILQGRTDDNMLTGEDLEMLSHIQQSRWEIWHNPAMRIVHKISDHRLQRSYLIPFFRGIGRSRYVTRMLRFKAWQRPLMTLAFLLNDLRRMIHHQFRHGRQYQHNLTLACEFELLLHSFLSPLYLWQHGYLGRRECDDA